MNNGCIFCTIRSNLIRILESFTQCSHRVGAFIREITRLVNPAPIAQTFFTDDTIHERIALDRVITIIDCKTFSIMAFKSYEAEEQIAFSDLDIVLLNRIDLINAKERAYIELLTLAINYQAILYATEYTNIPLNKILDHGSFYLPHTLDKDPHFLNHKHSDHVCAPACN
ncbi:GTP-binding protein [Bartonella sp. CB169]|uniref:GTP-binding protein n=1 Tax=Bartonella sp. CB169 TaxID=3112257 RepID=UPI00300E15A7